jgi:hypothetical protein
MEDVAEKTFGGAWCRTLKARLWLSLLLCF